MEFDLILEADVTGAQVRELAVLAERYGFRGLWTQNYSSSRDAFICLVPAAMTTSRILLGPVVVSPYEMHPIKIANSLMTLNEVSDGRAMIVIGAGGEWPGILGIGHGKRITGCREAIEIVRGAITGGVLNYDGEVYKARNYRSFWAKGQRPPLVYAGSTGEKMLAMATRVADGTMLSDIALPMLAKPMRLIREGLAAAGRTPDSFRISNFVAWHVKEDREASFRESRRELLIRGWLEREWLEAFLSAEETEFVLANRSAFRKAYHARDGVVNGIPADVVQRLVDGLSCAGDLSDLDRHVERLREFRAGGLSEIALRLHDNPADSIRMLGEKVLPRLR
ncbi:MAG: LLM class flavin-dependent oxidoreductase [Gammaproteobacteria bacterium]|nr:LLM class flavin-dependent oxidoreductase [Gammaproteobacteria bacterium]